MQNSLATLRSDQLDEIMLESDGFLTELEYLIEILRSRWVALAFYLLWFEAIAPHSQSKAMINHIHDRRFRDVVSWIEAAGDAPDKENTAAIARQFCASIIGIVYYWLSNPADLEATETLHAELKHTMRLLLAPKELS